MIIDTERVKRKAKPGIFSRPGSPIYIGRRMPPSKMRRRSEIFRLVFGALILAALAGGCAALIWTLASQSARYAEIKAQDGRENQTVPAVSMPITFKPSQSK